MSLQTPFTRSFVLVIVIIARKRGVRCIPEDVAPLVGVGLFCHGGLRGDYAISTTFSFYDKLVERDFYGSIRPSRSRVRHYRKTVVPALNVETLLPSFFISFKTRDTSRFSRAAAFLVHYFFFFLRRT